MNYVVLKIPSFIFKEKSSPKFEEFLMLASSCLYARTKSNNSPMILHQTVYLAIAISLLDVKVIAEPVKGYTADVQ